MSLVVVGSVVVSSIAAIMYCARRARVPTKDLSEILVNSSVSKLDTQAQLDSLFAQGGKVVVYLTATW